MTVRKNIVSFILAFILALIFIVYAVFVVIGNRDTTSDYLSFDGESFVVMGYKYTLSPNVRKITDEYFSMCKKSAELLIPKAISQPIKNAAEAFASAVRDAACGLHGVFSYLIHGNM